MRPLKILRILPVGYSRELLIYIQSIPNFKNLNYSHQKDILIKYAPSHLNSFSKCMRNLGHECDEIIFDLEVNRKKWAQENDAEFNEHSWKFDTLMCQIQKYKPDVLFLQGHNFFPYWIRFRLKEIFPFLKKIVIFTGFPGVSSDFKDVDHIFCCLPNIKDDFINAGCNASLAYYYFDEDVLFNLSENCAKSRDIECSFMGTSGYGGHWEAHISRYKLLDKIAQKIPIHLWVSEAEYCSANPIENYKPLLFKYPQNAKEACIGLDMYNVLGRSRINFNKHTDAANGDVGNMRMFEATGMGACLLNDNGYNLNDIFEVDREIVTYKSEEECMEKLDYLIQNPKEAEKIGEAGKKRTLKDHTLQKRCSELSMHIEKLFD